MEKIVFLMPSKRYKKIFEKETVEKLKKYGEVKIWDEKENIENFTKNSTIIITSWGSPEITSSIFKSAPDLKFIMHAAGSIKPYIKKEVMKKGVRVSSGSGVLGKFVAITTLGLILVSVKKIFWWSDFIKETGKWREDEKIMKYTDEIIGVNTGIISMSNVGRNLVSLLKQFTEKIYVYDPYCTEEQIKNYGGVKVKSLMEIAEKCEIVALCAPLTEETKGMIGKNFFKNMKDGAVFINTARGAIIDEKTLIEELKKERIFACLDVTYPEPPEENSPLYNLKNLIISPHIAGCVHSGLKELGKFSVEEIGRFIRGEKLENEIKLEKINIIA
ncbi:hydroxyacid dehydrogenase [bacterium]|nr:hydroxyacid dehydrogenase [bacterium]